MSALEAVRSLNLLLLDNNDSLDDMVRVCEINPRVEKIEEIRGKKTPIEKYLGKDIAVLSWRWDLQKPPGQTLETSIPLRSTKIMEFVRRSRDMGFKYAWVDWACIPQHPQGDAKGEIMDHVKASRLLYEECTVVITDLEEVFPGLKIPTTDYMTRLWTTAEMSAMLNNPNVNLGTFIRVEKYNLQTMGIAIGASWANATATLPYYVSDFENLKAGEMYHFEHMFTLAQHLFHIQYNFWSSGITEKYGRNVSSFFKPFQMLGATKLDDMRFAEEFPLSLDEQHAFITEYIEKYKCDGKKQPDLKALLDAIGDTEEMSVDFPLMDHYKAVLLLVYENYAWKMSSAKFNEKCFESVLRSLGEHPTEPKSDPNEAGALKFTMPGDDKIVKEMLLGLGEAPPPLTTKGFEPPKVPLGHELHTQQSLERNVFEVLKSTEFTGEKILTVMIQANESSVTMDITSLNCRMTISGVPDGNETSYIVWSKKQNPHEGHKKDDIKLNIHLSRSPTPEQMANIATWMTDPKKMQEMYATVQGYYDSTIAPFQTYVKLVEEMQKRQAKNHFKTEAEMLKVLSKYKLKAKK